MVPRSSKRPKVWNMGYTVQLHCMHNEKSARLQKHTLATMADTGHGALLAEGIE
jgi:hypothetical protein